MKALTALMYSTKQIATDYDDLIQKVAPCERGYVSVIRKETHEIETILGRSEGTVYTFQIFTYVVDDSNCPQLAVMPHFSEEFHYAEDDEEGLVAFLGRHNIDHDGWNPLEEHDVLWSHFANNETT